MGYSLNAMIDDGQVIDQCLGGTKDSPFVKDTFSPKTNERLQWSLPSLTFDPATMTLAPDELLCYVCH